MRIQVQDDGERVVAKKTDQEGVCESEKRLRLLEGGSGVAVQCRCTARCSRLVDAGLANGRAAVVGLCLDVL